MVVDPRKERKGGGGSEEGKEGWWWIRGQTVGTVVGGRDCSRY